MQGQKRPVMHVDGSGLQEQSEELHSLLDTESMFGCAICPGWCSAKSKPLGPCAASGENTACMLFVCAELKPWGEYGSFAYDVLFSLSVPFAVDMVDIGVIGVLCGSGEVWPLITGIGGIGGAGCCCPKFVLIGLRLLIFRA
jgi:hypothetical protein